MQLNLAVKGLGASLHAGWQTAPSSEAETSTVTVTVNEIAANVSLRLSYNSAGIPRLPQ